MKKKVLLLLFGLLVPVFGMSAPKVLLIVKEGSPQLEYMLTHEVIVMTETLRQYGMDVTIATESGMMMTAASVSVKPDLKLSEVNLDDYSGIIIPCMVIDLAPESIISLVGKAEYKGKIIAAQAGSVMIIARAGLLNAKKYTLSVDASDSEDFKNSIYSGTGVVQDGSLITSGTCPWLAKQSGREDGTVKLSKMLAEAINLKNK